MRISEIDTPAVVVDLDILERNIARVAGYAREHDLRLRPHTKTHKSTWLARKQLDAGAVGLTVAKVSEGEVMLGAEPAGLLVAYPVIGRKKIERLMALAGRTAVTVALDSVTAARQLSETAREARVEIGILTEVDAGLHRVGVAPGDIEALVKQVRNLPHLRWEGVAFYPGHIKSMDQEGNEAIDDLSRLVSGMVRNLRSAGLEPGIVSGGSTPALFHSHRVAGMNEIRPGTYVFNDRNTWMCGSCSPDDIAASVLVTVVSTARPGQIIVDGGSKTFSSDRLVTTGEPTYGYIPSAPEASFVKMNEEHGFVDIRRVKDADFQVGDKLRIIPNHVCVVMNLHEQVHGVRNGEVERVWSVEARGKLQ